MLRVISFGGLLTFIGLAWLMSSHRRRFPLRVVIGGLLLQFAAAALTLWTPPGLAEPIGAGLSRGISRGFDRLQGFVAAGAGFVFRVNGVAEPAFPADNLLTTFAFGVLPTIIVFSSLMSVLYYFGVMQWIVVLLARIMRGTLGTSGAESLSAAANIFVGHTEAPLVIQPYLPTMTESELNAVMVGGFATISGGLLAAFAEMGIDAGHLMIASVISAPASLLIAKVICPETGQPATLGDVRIDVPRRGVNVIEAAAAGASDGLKLALNVGAMLIAFLALIAMLDALIGGAGWLLQFRGPDGRSTWSLANLLGYGFAPVAWLMGIEYQDCRAAGELLGLKMVANEFIAYQRLGSWLQPESIVSLSPRSVAILTYALAGFSNFGAIGIQIGGIGGLAPDRRADLARLGLRAMLGGTIACCMTACVAGVLLP